MRVDVSNKLVRVFTDPVTIDIYNQSSGEAVTLLFQDGDGTITMYLSHEQIKFIAENCSNLPECGKGKHMNVQV